MEINNVRPVNDVGNVAQPASVKPALSEEQKTQLAKESVDKSSNENFSEKKEKNVDEAVDKLNKAAQVFDRSIRFQIHKKTNRTMVSVVDTANDKVIRQIPNEEVLNLVAKMDDYMGLIFDKKA
jgi:flagellar protein FlaG